MSETLLSAIIVAAGKSTRFGNPGKVFQNLGGKSVLEWVLGAFNTYPGTAEIVVVGQPKDQALIRTLAGSVDLRVPLKVAHGGENRQASVANGLAIATDAELISVHDAARPGVTPSLIARVANKALEVGAAVAGIPARDTIKRCSADGLVEETLDRSRLWQIATPQIFVGELVRRAHHQACHYATDDAGLVEAMGYDVAVVQADERITKLTTQHDFKALEAMLDCRVGRVGFGYDIHRIDPERELWLGGVLFPDGPGLDGHSDADVICHAIADALLGAMALGDIGQHFPNTDQEYKGISSLTLLQMVSQKIAKAAGTIVNLDVTLIAERPKIITRADEMRTNVANALGIAVEVVSVKATTAEKVGAAGREECMEAHAVAQVKAFDRTVKCQV